MPDALADAELTAYAAGRWPVVVRTLVLLGAPLPHAADLAVLAVARLLARCAEEDWLDLDAVLAAETVEVWERRPHAWWHRPALRDDGALAGTGVLEACAVLDALPPAERARLVVAARRRADAPSSSTTCSGPGPRRAWGPRGATTWPTWPRRCPSGTPGCGRPAPARPGVAAADARLTAIALVGRPGRRRRRGGRRPRARRPAAGPAPQPAAASRTGEPAAPRRGPDLLPVAWYDGRRVHLSDRIVTAAAASQHRPRRRRRRGDRPGAGSLLVRGVGTVEPWAGPRPGAVVSDPPGPPPRGSTWHRTARGPPARPGGLRGLPPGSQVLAITAPTCSSTRSSVARVRPDRPARSPAHRACSTPPTASWSAGSERTSSGSTTGGARPSRSRGATAGSPTTGATW